jgi:TrmH family RNA methyltransferase
VTKRVTSRENAVYKALARLAGSSRARRESRAAILDGPHLVAAFRASGGTAETLVVSESGHARGEIRALFDETPARVRVLLADRLFDSLAQVATPTGILAVVTAPGPQTLPAVLETCLLLEGIQDPGNLGSILRTAAAASVRQLFLAPGCAFAWSPKVLRAGQGAHFGLSIHEGAPLVALADRFQGQVVATDPRASASVFELELTGPVAWVLGGEGGGVSPELAAHATVRARVPMPGTAESLNVAAVAAICLFEQVRQREAAARGGTRRNLRKSS